MLSLCDPCLPLMPTVTTAWVEGRVAWTAGRVALSLCCPNAMCARAQSCFWMHPSQLRYWLQPRTHSSLFAILFAGLQTGLVVEVGY